MPGGEKRKGTSPYVNEVAASMDMHGGTPGEPDWQGRYIEHLSQDVHAIRESLERTEQRIEARVSEIVHESMEQARHLDAARHEDVNSIREDLRAMRSDVNGLNRWLIALVIITLLGIGALTYTAISTMHSLL